METIVVFDMDGVLAEVSESYRQSIVETVAHFTGQRIELQSIQDYKNQGGWNNDWALSQKIASDLGVAVLYDEVVRKFNQIFLGQNGDGLILKERWIPEDGLLDRLRSACDLAIFTGRDRYELDLTLRRFVPRVPFSPVICAEDVERGKPAPDGLHAIQRARPGAKLWFLGDTVDDARSARAAGVPFVGIAAGMESRNDGLLELFRNEGAVAIIDNVNQIERVLA